MGRMSIKNKKLLSAMMIGISTMMALQPPVIAFADEGDGATENNTQNQGADAEALAVQAESIETQDAIDDAVVQAGEVQDALVGTDGAENADPSAQENEPSAAVKVQELEEFIKNDADEVVNALNQDDADSQQKVQNLVDSAAAIPTTTSEDVKDENGNTVKDEDGNDVKEDVPSVDANLQNASDNIEEAKTALDSETEGNLGAKQDEVNAQAAYNDAYVDDLQNNTKSPYTEATEAFKEAVDQMEGENGIIDFTQKVNESVTETNEKAQEIIGIIEAADTEEEAKEAKSKLDAFVDSIDTLSGQVTVLQSLVDKYDSAVTALSEAEKKLDVAEAAMAEAEGKRDEKIQEALDNLKEAQEDVDKAQFKVDRLSDALDSVKDLVPEAEDLEDGDLVGSRDSWGNTFGTSKYVQTRQVMKDVIANYILPVTYGLSDVEIIEWTEPQEATSNYKIRYTTVEYSYTNAEGVKVTEKKNFNWDSLARTATEEKLTADKDAESALGIVIYEKRDDEVLTKQDIENIAIARIQDIVDSGDEAYYINYNNLLFNDYDPVHKKEYNNVKKAKEQNMFTLYSYTDDEGVTQYITQIELFGKYPGQVGVTLPDMYKVPNLCEKTNKGGFDSYTDEDGVIWYETYDGVKYRNLQKVLSDKEVTQNKNALYYDANCLIVGQSEDIENVLRGNTETKSVYNNIVLTNAKLDEKKIASLIEENKKLNDYIGKTTKEAKASALKAQYDGYKKEVEAAKAAVDNASDEVDALNDAIVDIQNKAVTRTARTRKALEVLGVDDLSTYLGIEGLSNDLTMDQLINELKGKRTDAVNQLNEANADLKAANDKKAEANEKYQKAVEDIKKASEKSTSTQTQTQNQETKVTPIQNEETKVTPAQNEETNVTPAQNEETNVTPAQNEETNVTPVQNEETNVTPAQNEETNVTPVQNEETNVTPAQNEETNVTPAQNEQTNVAPVQAAETNVAPTQNLQTDAAQAQDTAPSVAPVQATEPVVAPAQDAEAIITPKPVPLADTPAASDVDAAPAVVFADDADAADDDFTPAVTVATTTAAPVAEALAAAPAAVAGDVVQAQVAGDAVQADAATAQAGGVQAQIAGAADQAGAAAQNAEAGQGVEVDIADPDVALADTPNQKTTTQKTADDKKNVVNIEDDQTAKSDTFEMPEENISWLWLLIILLLGAAGKKMYDEYKNKKNENEEIITR